MLEKKNERNYLMIEDVDRTLVKNLHLVSSVNKHIDLTSSARLRTRSTLSRRDRTSELLANYLFKVKMLFTSHLVIPILSRLLNNSNRSRVRISHP